MKEFTIESRDMKTALACYKWEPKGTPKAVLIVVHGMSEHMMRYTELAEYMVSQGIVVAGLDLLGHGKSAPSSDEFGYFCEGDPATVIVRDVHRLKKTVQAEYPGIPVYIMGHSMGSFIVRNYIERYGTGIKGAVIQGGCGTLPAAGIMGKVLSDIAAFFHGWHYKSTLITAVILGPYFKAFPGDPNGWLTKRKEVVEAYADDPYSGFIFTLNGYHTLAELTLRAGNRKLMERIPKDLPLFIVSGEDDPVGEMGKGVRRMYESYKKAGFSNVKLDIRPTDRHELHNEEDRYQVFEEIRDFILG